MWFAGRFGYAPRADMFELDVGSLEDFRRGAAEREKELFKVILTAGAIVVQALTGEKLDVESMLKLASIGGEEGVLWTADTPEEALEKMRLHEEGKTCPKT